MSGHTPGPWTVTPDSFVMAGSRPSIGVARIITHAKEFVANALLIAAAPELLEALRASVAATDRELEAFRRNLGRNPLVMPEWLAGARAAIAKAEGR